VWHVKLKPDNVQHLLLYPHNLFPQPRSILAVDRAKNLPIVGRVWRRCVRRLPRRKPIWLRRRHRHRPLQRWPDEQRVSAHLLIRRDGMGWGQQSAQHNIEKTYFGSFWRVLGFARCKQRSRGHVLQQSSVAAKQCNGSYQGVKLGQGPRGKEELVVDVCRRRCEHGSVQQVWVGSVCFVSCAGTTYSRSLSATSRINRVASKCCCSCSFIVSPSAPIFFVWSSNRPPPTTP